MKKITALFLAVAVCFALCGCGNSKSTDALKEEIREEIKEEIIEEAKEEIRQELAEETEDETQSKDENEQESIPEEKVENTDTVTGIRPEIKEALDSYEAFMDEYVEFMKKYEDPGSSLDALSMLGEYTSMLQKYAEFAEEIDDMDTEDMNSAELAYYLEVTSRVNQKLLEVAV